MTLLHQLCRTCHGIHVGIPTCVGRPQTDAEWMIDRGIPRERADEIIAARRRHSEATGHVFPAMARPPADPARLF